MAFHPFQSFRKHQKKLLAVTTIFVMFIFILSYSSGGADPITRLMGVFGGSRHKDKTPVTTLYGKKITVGDLEDLRQNRNMVDRFIKSAILSPDMKLGPEDSKEVAQHFQEIEMKHLAELFSGQGSEKLNRDALEYYHQLVNANKTDAARYVLAGLRSLLLRAWQPSHPGEPYFGGGLSGEDLLDFKIWLQQADRLNIALTDEDVRREVNRDAGYDVLTGKSSDDDAKVRSLLGNFGRTIEPKDIYSALKDEYRVRLAQEMLVGGPQGARAGFATGLAGDRTALGVTPAEFWDYFKENRTELKVDFLRVPVEPFLALVNEKPPSDEELHKLYERYSTFEPSPDRAEPGFKIPRRVRVAYIGVDPNSEFYRKAAKDALPEKVVPYLPAADALTLASAIPSIGGLPCGALGWVGPASLAVADPVQLEYGKYVSNIKSSWDAPSSDPNNPFPINEHRPEAIAAFVGLLGQTGGQLATQGPWQGVDAALTAVVAHQRKEKADREAAMVLAAANPFPLAAMTQEAALANVRVPSFDDVKSDMVQSVYNDLNKQLANATLEKFKKDLEAKRSNPDEVEKFINENTKPAQGITIYRAMEKPKSEMEIANDPALEPLRKASAGLTPLKTADLQRFAEKFFDEKEMFGRKPPAKELYQPETMTTANGTEFEYWLTEKVNPSIPKFKDAKPQVEEAWKLDKARELANAKAKEIIEKLKDRGEGTRPEKFLEDEAARLKQTLNLKPTAGLEDKPMTITKNISKLTERPNPMKANPEVHYEPFPLSDLGFDYAPKNTVEDLFKGLHNPGDATIIKDVPERTVYVAVLLDKPMVPSKDLFLSVYRRAAALLFHDPLWDGFLANREQQFRSDLMRQLREQSGAPLEETGDYKMDPEVRRRLRSDTRGEE